MNFYPRRFKIITKLLEFFPEAKSKGIQKFHKIRILVSINLNVNLFIGFRNIFYSQYMCVVIKIR
jgi:hypothetical protein